MDTVKKNEILSHIKGPINLGLIKSIRNNSNEKNPSNEYYIARVFIEFNNGHNVSVIRGQHTYGGDRGLFEIMPDNPDVFDEGDRYDTVLGHLSHERVTYYINKIGNMPKIEI